MRLKGRASEVALSTEEREGERWRRREEEGGREGKLIKANSSR